VLNTGQNILNTIFLLIITLAVSLKYPVLVQECQLTSHTANAEHMCRTFCCWNQSTAVCSRLPYSHFSNTKFTYSSTSEYFFPPQKRNENLFRTDACKSGACSALAIPFCRLICQPDKKKFCKEFLVFLDRLPGVTN